MSLPADDLDFLDTYARAKGFPSRSAALHCAVTLLRATELAGSYEDAWQEWESSGEAGVWELSSADGLER